MELSTAVAVPTEPPAKRESIGSTRALECGRRRRGRRSGRAQESTRAAQAASKASSEAVAASRWAGCRPGQQRARWAARWAGSDLLTGPVHHAGRPRRPPVRPPASRRTATRRRRRRAGATAAASRGSTRCRPLRLHRFGRHSWVAGRRAGSDARCAATPGLDRPAGGPGRADPRRAAHTRPAIPRRIRRPRPTAMARRWRRRLGSTIRGSEGEVEPGHSRLAPLEDAER